MFYHNSLVEFKINVVMSLNSFFERQKEEYKSDFQESVLGPNMALAAAAAAATQTLPLAARPKPPEPQRAPSSAATFRQQPPPMKVCTLDSLEFMITHMLIHGVNCDTVGIPSHYG